MKRPAAIILTALFLLTFTDCDFLSDFPEESENSIPTDSGECATPDESENSAADGSISESPTLSEDDILDSVLSSLERGFDKDKYGTYTTYNFINDEDGFFFHFAFSNNQNQLILFMKTLDGGKTWFPQAIEKMPSTHWKERIICAKMINDSVGIISGAFYADNESVSRRIFITTNGGITWNNVRIPYMGIDTGNSEVYDIKYEDGKYILCFRMLETSPEHHYVYFDYVSTDLVNWELVN